MEKYSSQIDESIKANQRLTKVPQIHVGIVGIFAAVANGKLSANWKIRFFGDAKRACRPVVQHKCVTYIGAPSHFLWKTRIDH